MFSTHSVAGRIFIGKMVGLVVGLVFMTFATSVGIGNFTMLSWGALLMFVLMGAMIGVMGMFSVHPYFGFPLRWWVRGPAIGLVFISMFALLTFEELSIIMQSPLITWTGLSSPWWILADGLVLGGIMGYLCTKISGEGSGLPLR